MSSYNYEVFNGQTSTGIKLYDFETMCVYNGGRANSTSATGILCRIDVSSGGSANNTTITNAEARMVILGGTANNTTVNRGALTVSQGGTANITTVNSYGMMHVSSGGTANRTTINSGTMHAWGTVNSTTVNYQGAMYVSSGGTANSTTVNWSGHMTVNGSANFTTVNSGGRLYVSRGGTATNIVWTPCIGSVVAEDGAIVTYAGNYQGVYFGINDSLISSAGVMSGKELAGHSMYVMSGGTADFTTVNSGYLAIFGGGTANSTTLNSKGTLYVSNGGTANSTTVNSYGSMTVCSGGTANDTTADEGSMTVCSGGTANGTILSGGWQSGLMDVRNGGTANSTTVTFSGRLTIAGTANSTTVNSGGGLVVYRSGTANNTDVNTGGRLYVSSGGTASVIFNPWQGNVYSSAGAHVTYLGRDANIYYGNQTDGLISKWNGVSELAVSSGYSAIVYSEGNVSGATVTNGGRLEIQSGGKVTGQLTMEGGAVVSAYAGSIIDFDLSGLQASAPVRVNNLSLIQGNSGYSITVSASQASGTYGLAEGAAGFNKTVTIRTTGNVSSTITVGNTVELSGQYYTLDLTNSLLSLTVSGQAPEPEGTKVNLLENGVSQVLAWDGAQGKVGFMATDGNPSPSWRGVWEWSGADASLWKVVGAGHFSGSTVDHDGILLYNGIGNTFAAWTNLNDPSYGYVSLCHVDGNFQTKCLGDFDNNGFDDVIIYNEKGSVGIVSDAASYHDVWHVDNAASNPWQLLGAGTFDSTIGQDSILFKNTSNNHLYLWDNQGADPASWNWRQTDIGYLADGWEFAAIGDFAGDGIDDIVLVNHNDNDAVFVWDDGDQSTAHYVGVLGSGFEIETVGDYDGDGKDDLLLREYNTGWGGIGCWSGADANSWTDFNARIETNMESQFTIVA